LKKYISIARELIIIKIITNQKPFSLPVKGILLVTFIPKIDAIKFRGRTTTENIVSIFIILLILKFIIDSLVEYKASICSF
jgi:hypothetical protein